MPSPFFSFHEGLIFNQVTINPMDSDSLNILIGWTRAPTNSMMITSPSKSRVVSVIFLSDVPRADRFINLCSTQPWHIVNRIWRSYKISKFRWCSTEPKDFPEGFPVYGVELIEKVDTRCKQFRSVVTPALGEEADSFQFLWA